jgi:hypothetical protein
MPAALSVASSRSWPTVRALSFAAAISRLAHDLGNIRPRTVRIAAAQDVPVEVDIDV